MNDDGFTASVILEWALNLVLAVQVLLIVLVYTYPSGKGYDLSIQEVEKGTITPPPIFNN